MWFHRRGRPRDFGRGLYSVWRSERGALNSTIAAELTESHRSPEKRQLRRWLNDPSIWMDPPTLIEAADAFLWAEECLDGDPQILRGPCRPNFRVICRRQADGSLEAESMELVGFSREEQIAVEVIPIVLSPEEYDAKFRPL